jgi:hypothetical protein
MEFHMTCKVLESRSGKQADIELRESLAAGFGALMGSGKVRDAGFLGGQRGAYFLVRVDAPEELYALLGPEIYGNCAVEAHPVIPFDKGVGLFQQWAEEGR